MADVTRSPGVTRISVGQAVAKTAALETGAPVEVEIIEARELRPGNLIASNPYAVKQPAWKWCLIERIETVRADGSGPITHLSIIGVNDLKMQMQLVVSPTQKMGRL